MFFSYLKTMGWAIISLPDWLSVIKTHQVCFFKNGYLILCTKPGYWSSLSKGYLILNSIDTISLVVIYYLPFVSAFAVTSTTGITLTTDSTSCIYSESNKFRAWRCCAVNLQKVIIESSAIWCVLSWSLYFIIVASVKWGSCNNGCWPGHIPCTKYYENNWIVSSVFAGMNFIALP